MGRRRNGRIVDSHKVKPYLEHLKMTVLEMTTYTDLRGEETALLLTAIARVKSICSMKIIV